MAHIDIDLSAITASNEIVLTPKIVQYQGNRYCIRLEEMYWAVLEAEAKSRGLKFNQLVHEYYTHPDAATNRTAFLRRHTVEWLAHSLAERQSQIEMEQREVACILKATKRAAFLFTEDFDVCEYNQQFRHWLIGETGVLDEEKFRKLRVSFQTSSRILFSQIEDNAGIARLVPAAVLIPGYALTIRLDVIAIHNYNGKPAYLSIIRQKD